jgi:hypothetical protein
METKQQEVNMHEFLECETVKDAIEFMEENNAEEITVWEERILEEREPVSLNKDKLIEHSDTDQELLEYVSEINEWEGVLSYGDYGSELKNAYISKSIIERYPDGKKKIEKEFEKWGYGQRTKYIEYYENGKTKSMETISKMHPYGEPEKVTNTFIQYDEQERVVEERTDTLDTQYEYDEKGREVLIRKVYKD